MSYKVLLLDGIDAICEQIFLKRGMEAVNAPKLKGDELLAELPKYDGLVVRSATQVTKALLKHASNLKVIGRAGVGVDNIDVDAATEAGILVMNTPDGNTISTAEHTCGLLLSLARNIPNAVSSLKNDAWDRKKYTGSELHGKVLGVVGLGKIGSNVAQRMRAFGMDIIAYDPFTTHEKAQEMGVKLVELDELLATADFVTLHTPLTDKTRGLISLKFADKLKKGIRLVNCARGGIIEEQDIPALLDQGIVGGMALDVYSNEPPTPELYAILKHPKVICTPHLGASTDEAQEKVAEDIAYQMADALELKSFKGSLNGKAIALSTNKEVQPFLKLADRLGRFAAQLASKHVKKLSFTFTGSAASHGEVLTDAILKGYLQNQTDEVVNLINARYLAAQRGIATSETVTSSSHPYSHSVGIELEQEDGFKQLVGTSFGEDDFRVVRINGHAIEIKLEGDILLYRNEDKPGMLAAVSSALAREKINIASASLGRGDKGGKAITAIAVDKRLTKSDVEPISRLDGVHNVRYINL